MAVAHGDDVRVRLAPSPTGPFHIGTARTALFNWLFARKHDGAFVLRIEDTDGERSDAKYESEIAEGLLWLGLAWDEGPEIPRAGKKVASRGTYGPYRQSERKKIYRTHIEKLLTEDKAYYCYCTREELEAERQTMLGQGLPPRYNGHCRNLKEAPGGKAPQVIRFKILETIVEFKDLIRGKVQFDAGLFGDIVIAKDAETPLYNFAAVVDDEMMNITHVIRGEDHLPNTPKQILLQKAMNFHDRLFAHLPLILGPDRSKLSKRYADTSLLEYRRRGHLPEAMVNFLALIGWHPRDEREVLSRDDLIKEFELKRVQKAGAIFNEEKLESLNALYIRNLGDDEIIHRLEALEGAAGEHKAMFADAAMLRKIIHVEKERLKNLTDFFELAGFFFELPNYEANLLVWQKEPVEKIRYVIEEAIRIVSGYSPKQFHREEISAALQGLVEKEGRGTVLWPVRVALSGRAASPDPFDIIEVLGYQESLRRLEIAREKLAATS